MSSRVPYRPEYATGTGRGAQASVADRLSRLSILEDCLSNPLDTSDVPARVQAAVDAEISSQSRVLSEIGDELTPLVAAVGALLQGGKRLRAAFLYWGYRAGGGQDTESVIRAATAMEFFQAAALLHDDVMDDSDTRRGMPAAHRRLADEHAAAGAIAPVEEGCPESFPTLQQGTDRRHQRGEFVADLRQDPGLGGDFGVDSGLYACAQITGVQWIRQGGPPGC